MFYAVNSQNTPWGDFELTPKRMYAAPTELLLINTVKGNWGRDP